MDNDLKIVKSIKNVYKTIKFKIDYRDLNVVFQKKKETI